MPRIDRKIIQHRLNVNLECKLVQQKRRIFASEHNKAVVEEVEKLLEADFIREVFYPNWLANVVMEKKSNGQWRMCVDFTDLNKACPKDSFPLPRIDQLVDLIARHKLLSFMDTFILDTNRFLWMKTIKRRPCLLLAKGCTATKLCLLD